ncbi:MAG: 1-acyl-sn-glycerol-3-phosphate acyltransferase [Deltaproteobacteria bacterium]|nr:1-acyl-sn-glycerol-3-phosphate acyltransferase [Deltaproteobacteria bacterium]MBW2359998.1 1-acyl-sn-glycerol-3-phosphate acyltransferase [Deltaproteobacteria bacterium]
MRLDGSARVAGGLARGLYSCVFWLFLVGSSIALFPAALLIWALTTPFDRRKRVLHLFTCFWASLYTWLNPAWTVTLEGREKLRSDRAAVLVANHLSLLDILVLFRTFTHFKWVSKIENFRLPFVGWNMSLNGYIKIRRGNRASVVQMMRACEATLAAGNSIMMFPEGTRSLTGLMRAFKPGAFELALCTKTPIQPILLRGSGDALPKRGFVLQGHYPIRVTVLDPIAPESFAGLSVNELTDRVRTLMAKELGQA